MLQKMLMASAIVLVSVAAHAETSSQSEFFYQTPAGKSDVSVTLGYKTMTIKPDGATEDTKINGLYKSGVAYEYGINEMFAIEGKLSFNSLENDASPKIKESGLEDPEVTLKGTSGMDWGRLRYGASLGLGLEKRKVKSNGDENAASGGFSLTPYIGADANVGPGILGGRLSYRYNMERTIEVPVGSDEKRKEGNVLGLSAFYEYFVTDVVLGGAINYKSLAATKDGDDNEVGKSYDITGISLYSRIPMGTWDLVPKIDYDFSAKDFDKYQDLNFFVTARFGF